MVREDRDPFYFVFTCACVFDKNPKTPKLCPMADDAITQGGTVAQW